MSARRPSHLQAVVDAACALGLLQVEDLGGEQGGQEGVRVSGGIGMRP